jgi:hypothetical protein
MVSFAELQAVRLKNMTIIRKSESFVFIGDPFYVSNLMQHPDSSALPAKYSNRK